MLLVDTSIWIDHFRGIDNGLAEALDQNRVMVHPFVIGELALGNLPQRQLIIARLTELPGAIVADPAEVLAFIDRHALAEIGIGYVDAHLLAGASLSGSGFWTRDKRLESVAARVGLARGLARGWSPSKRPGRGAARPGLLTSAAKGGSRSPP